MIPAAFDYERAESVDQAVQLLGSREDWDQREREEHGHARQRILHYGSAARAARPGVAGRFSSTNFVSNVNRCCRVVPPEIEWVRFG